VLKFLIYCGISYLKDIFKSLSRENLVNESKVRSLVRSQIKKKIILESYIKTCDIIIEANQLNEFDISSMADSAASFLGDNLGDAFTSSIKQYLVELLFRRLESMGFPISAESIVGRAIVNTIQKLEWTNLSKYFTDENACGEIADVLIGGIQEGLQERGIDELTAVLFGIPGRRLTGPIGSPIRELLNIKINEMTQSLRDPIKEFLCDHRDIEQLISGFRAGLPSMSLSSEDNNDSPAFMLKEL